MNDEIVILRTQGLELRCPRSRMALEVSILQGRYGVGRLPTDARRVLDIGAGIGAFAVWASRTWPGCWVDCFEPDDAARELLAENGPAGMRVIAEPPPFDLRASYDVVRMSIATYDTGLSGPHVIVDYQEAS